MAFELPKRVQLEVDKGNTPRSRKIINAFGSGMDRARIWNMARDLWPEVNFKTGIQMAPLPAPETDPEPPILPPGDRQSDVVLAPEEERVLAGKKPGALRDSAEVTGTLPARTVLPEQLRPLEPFLKQNCTGPYLDPADLPAACEAVAQQDMQRNGGRLQWTPTQVIQHLVKVHILRDGTPDYFERTYIRYLDGARLQQARSARGMTQQRLAALLKDLLGIEYHYSTIRNWERSHGRPTGERVAALAACLDVPIECLYEGGPSLPLLQPFGTSLTTHRRHASAEPAEEPQPPTCFRLDTHTVHTRACREGDAPCPVPTGNSLAALAESARDTGFAVLGLGNCLETPQHAPEAPTGGTEAPPAAEWPLWQRMQQTAETLRQEAERLNGAAETLRTADTEARQSAALQVELDRVRQDAARLQLEVEALQRKVAGRDRVIDTQKETIAALERRLMGE